MADTRTMSLGFAEMTGFSPSVVEKMRARFERRFDFRWDEIEPVGLAAKVEADALVIHDRDDMELPAEEGEALAGALPAGRSHITTGLGHRRILRDAGVVSKTVDFILRSGVTGKRSIDPDRAAPAA
jgi:pimeloyl-ACP methyl ester carboxylesterase